MRDTFTIKFSDGHLGLCRQRLKCKIAEVKNVWISISIHLYIILSWRFITK